MRLLFPGIAAVLLLGVLCGCGELPRPFAGNPGATARRLAQPPPARLAVPRPTTAFLAAPAGTAFADDLAASLVAQEIPAFAEPVRPGDWQLAVNAQPRNGSIVPVYTVKDPTGAAQGSVDGPPVSPEAWAAADQPAGAAVLRQAAADAAKPLAALLIRIDAARRQSDPNSLLNRPARVAFGGITGAPGDGDTSLARQLHVEMAKIGEPLEDNIPDADYTVSCQVKVTPIAGGQVRVEIQWIVKDARGAEAGRVVQLNDIPAGTLDHYWGDVAVVVAQEAAGGVRDVILNQIGKRR